MDNQETNRKKERNEKKVSKQEKRINRKTTTQIMRETLEKEEPIERQNKQKGKKERQ